MNKNAEALPELSSGLLAQRIIEQEKHFATLFRRFLLVAVVLYALQTAIFWLVRYTRNTEHTPELTIALEPGEAATTLGVIATIVVATNLAVWLERTPDADSWKWLARQRYARWGNSLLAVAAMTVGLAALFDGVPASNPVGGIIVAVLAVVIVGVAADAASAIDPKNPLQIRIRKVQIGKQITQLRRNARDADSAAGHSKWSVAKSAIRDTFAVAVSSWIPAMITYVALMIVADVSGNRFLSSVLLGAVAFASVALAAGSVIGIRLSYDTRNFDSMCLIALSAALTYVWLAVGVLFALDGSTAGVVALVSIMFGIILLVPLVLLALSTCRTQFCRILPRSPRLFIDRSIHKSIVRLEKEQSMLDDQLLLHGALLLPSSVYRSPDSLDFAAE